MTPIYSIDLSVDGTYFILKDLTPIATYTDEGIDISTDITSVIFTLTDPDSVDYPLDVTSDFVTSMRDVNGLQISTTDLSYSGDYFVDGRYTSELVITEDSTTVDVDHTGTSDDIFYSQINQIAISQIKDADWKELYNPYTKILSNEIRKRLYLLDIEYASTVELFDEADRIRLALNKLCSYVG
jgi:hypothetical protein